MTAHWIVAVAMLATFGAAWAQDSGRAIRDAARNQPSTTPHPQGPLPRSSTCSICVQSKSAWTCSSTSFRSTPPTWDSRRKRSAKQSGATPSRARLRGARGIHERSAGPLLHARFAIGVPDEGHVPFYSIEISFLRELFAMLTPHDASSQPSPRAVRSSGDLVHGRIGPGRCRVVSCAPRRPRWQVHRGAWSRTRNRGVHRAATPGLQAAAETQRRSGG